MEFVLRIKSDNYYAVDQKCSTFGYEGLETIRKQLGVNVGLDRVENKIYSLGTDVSITISESTAKGIEHFAEKSKVVVMVPRGYLNSFVEKEMYTNRDISTDEIESCGFKWSVQKQDILQAWINAGTPLFWECEDKG